MASLPKLDVGLIRGMPICFGAPPLSHLLFADNNLFFCQANASECIHVMNALRVYEVASRKKINLSKSKVCFSRNVKPPMKNRLNLILGVRYVSRHEKYLGMPSKLERETP
ncbi:hypothetical protein ACFX13_025143 [Malus domestica]